MTEAGFPSGCRTEIYLDDVTGSKRQSGHAFDATSVDHLRSVGHRASAEGDPLIGSDPPARVAAVRG
jgi:hypothetical protein